MLLALAGAGETPQGRLPIPHPWVYMIWTVTKVPTITLPLARDEHGLPIGAQLSARRLGDRRRFVCARWVGQRWTATVRQ